MKHIVRKLIPAMRQSIRNLVAFKCIASEHTIGIIDYPEHPGYKIQISVKAAVFSEALLKSQPLSGGLLERAKGRWPRWLVRDVQKLHTDKPVEGEERKHV